MGKRRFVKRFVRAPKMKLAWFRSGAVTLQNQVGAADGCTLLALASPMYPDFGGSALDFGRREMIKIIRIICKIILVISQGGAAQNITTHIGLRLDEADADGSLRPAADQPSILQVTDDNRREDWLYRTSTFTRLETTSNNVPVRWGNDQPMLTLDFKPNRPFPQRAALVLHLRNTLVGTSTNADNVMEASSCDLQMLVGKR